MDDLVAFLTARIDEDEQWAKDAAHKTGNTVWEHEEVGYDLVRIALSGRTGLGPSGVYLRGTRE